MTTETFQTQSPTAANGSIAGRIGQLREMQSELRSRPVTGSLPAFKKLVFQVIRSTFSRQFNHNAATVDLIESLHRELQHQRLQLQQQSLLLQNQARQIRPPVEASETPISTGEVLASCGLTQDQAKLNNIRPLSGFNAVYTSPAELRMPERVLLYSLVFGLQPRNCLEIGTFRGGSTAIICGAMDDTGFGQIVCVDPLPKVTSDLWSQISHRCRMFEGPSPEILPEVAQQTGVAFDLTFIDANHTYEFVRRDFEAVLSLLANEAYLLFHDGNYPDVERAISEVVSEHNELVDCGLLSVEPTVLHENNRTSTYAGLRLVRFQRSLAG